MDHVASAVDPFVFRLSIFVLAVFVIVIDFVVTLIERRLLIWRPAVGDQRP